MGTRSPAPVGQRFGRLTVVADASAVGAPCQWRCVCDCGTERVYFAGNVRRGLSSSCGCRKAEVMRAQKWGRGHGATKHGGAVGGLSPEYRVWRSVLTRTIRNAPVRGYAERGITLCLGWRVYENFRADMGLRPSPEHSIDRKDNDGSYTCGRCSECVAKGWPANCRWATPTEQARNRRSNVVLVHGGETMLLTDWAARTGIRATTISFRLKLGWSVDRALTEPAKIGRRAIAC